MSVTQPPRRGQGPDGHQCHCHCLTAFEMPPPILEGSVACPWLMWVPELSWHQRVGEGSHFSCFQEASELGDALSLQM